MSEYGATKKVRVIDPAHDTDTQEGRDRIRFEGWVALGCLFFWLIGEIFLGY
jgi:hypothetical protein